MSDWWQKVRLGYEGFWGPGASAPAATNPPASRTSSQKPLPGMGPNVRGVGPGRGGGATPVVASWDPGIKNALRNGRQVMSPVSFGRPGLLMTAVGAGTAGAVMGNGDASSFAIGAAAGIGGGYLAEAGARMAYKGLSTFQKKNAGKMSDTAFKAVGLGRMITSSSSRGMIFGAGALLAGGMFSSMFASNSTSYKRGFNAQRGNSIVR